MRSRNKSSVNAGKAQQAETKSRSGAAILIDALNQVGIEYIFAHTGGAVIPIHVELTKRAKNKQPSPKVIMFRQEPGAGHAAEGYARVSGKPVAVIATSGPGATNLLTPMADAYRDSVPVLFITGQVPSHLIGTDAFQEVDIITMSMPVTKHNYLVKDVHSIGWVVKQACYIATSGRKGPVHIDLCKDAQLAVSTEGHKEQEPRGYHPTVQLDETAAALVLQELATAKRPVIYAGGGVNSPEAAAGLRRFAELFDLPVTLSLKGLGALPSTDRNFIGMPGMHGTVAANYSLRDADFILAIGARFSDRVHSKGFGDHARIAHIDIDACEINKIRRSQISIQADASEFLDFVSSQKPTAKPDWSEWHSKIATWKKLTPEYKPKGNKISAAEVVKAISAHTKGNAIVVTGVGQHQMFTAQHYGFQHPMSLVTSGGLGTMGFDVPAAIGAYFAAPDREIVLIDGDGSFQMNMQELALINAYEMPIKTFIFNNSYLGMVRQWEDMFSEGMNSETCLPRDPDCPPGCTGNAERCVNLNPDFLGLTGMYKNIQTIRITRKDQIAPTLKKVFSDKRPYVVDVWTDKDENVLPMIPQGKGISEIMY